MSACPRCGTDRHPLDMVRVPRDPDAVTTHHGLPDIPTVTVCSGCVKATEPRWANND